MKLFQIILNFINFILYGNFIGYEETLSFKNSTIIKIHQENAKLHAFKPIPYVVSSYIVELKTKLVIFDMQYEAQNARNFLDYANSLNKKIDHVILTHYHFDHWVGFDVFKNVAPIYALNETINQINDIYIKQKENSFKSAAIEFLKYVKPISINQQQIDGVEFQYETIRDAENPITLITRMPKQSAMVVGDLVYNKFYMYVGEIKSFESWINVLNYFLQKYPYNHILIGHGNPSDKSALIENIQYLEFVRSVAAQENTLAAYRAKILAKYPNYGNVGIVNCPFTNFSCPYGNF